MTKQSFFLVFKLEANRRNLGRFPFTKKIRKISTGNFRLGRERSICHKSHSFTGPSPSLQQTTRCLSSAPISVKPGEGGGVGCRVGILTFFKKIVKIPTPGRKRIVKISRNKINGLLLFYYIKLKDQMHDVRSKSPPWGYRS